MVEKEITRRAMIHLLSVLAKWRLAVQVIVEQGEIDKVIIPPLFMFKLLYELYCHPEKGPKKGTNGKNVYWIATLKSHWMTSSKLRIGILAGPEVISAVMSFA